MEMTTLPSLPNELLCLVCNYLYPPDHCCGLGDDDDHNCYSDHAEHMEDLYQLSRVNRRLLSVVEPILYARGIGYRFATPLAWSAKFGIAATLHKALAAGASPDRKLRCQMTGSFWRFANDARQATLDWAAGDPKYWPPLSDDRLGELDDEEEVWAKDMTSGLADFDVRYPAEVCPSAGLAGNRSPDSSTVDLAQPPQEPPPELYEGAEHLFREYTALHLAAREGHTDFVNLLLANGASVNSSSRWFCPCRPPRGLWQTMLDQPTSGHLLKPVDWLPLHAAICSSHIEIAKSLLLAGATVVRNPPNGPASYGALHQAAAAGHVDLVRYILDTHPEIDVDVPDELGMTPFYHAYINARWDSTIPILMARGANINSRVRVVCNRRHGDVRDSVRLDATPLAEACRLGRFEDALKLIDLGADVTMGVQLGNRFIFNMNIPPLHLCCMDFSLDNEFYPTGEAIWSRALGQRAFRGAAIARLVAAGVSPDAKMGFIGFGVETALAVAVRHTNVTAVEALLAAGAGVGIRNLKGRNELMVSVEPPAIDSPSEMSLGFLSYAPAYLGSLRIAHSDAWAITKLLIDAGVSLVDGDEDGNTVLHLLFDTLDEDDRFRIESPSDMGILRLLLARGADPCLRNKKGVPALHVAVRNRRLAAVQCIAAQGRIDLVKTFPIEDVGTLFDAVQLEDDIEDETTDPSWEAFLSDSHRFSTATLRLIDALVNMDRSGRLSSDVSFICSRLHKRHRKDPALEVAEILCYRGLAADTFDGEAKLTILRAAIKAARWDMARALLRGVPGTDINSLDPEGHTLLSLVTSSRRMHGGEFAWELVEAGADIHIRVAPSLPCGEDTTPLKQALMWPDTYPIKRMLQKQPIRGNPPAIEQRYLHWAVTLPWNPSLEEECSESVWCDRDTIVRALLVAGADPTQLDSNGDTPLLRAAREMDENKDDVCREIGHWVKPLSRGVDGRRKNNQGHSIVDYLTKIINERELSDLEFMHGMIVFSLTEDGKSVKRAIRWPPK
ncbi:ankyrin repeat-containing domain protein [Chaetomium tenue]|uniref:Ankyrin repeat-containing domain protein n=1 Tax=Chaetomium tenue TaxID=1854479 RepID=A0ACB7PG27_9PEZI|nr:ankyrin repeat-containing domain protein [Chaetomium globosum]